MLPDYMMERQSPDKKLFVSASTTVPLHKRYIFVSAATGTTIKMTLPNVGEAEGLKFVFSAVTAAAAATVDYSDGTGANNSTTMSTTGVETEFESIGTEWIITRQGA